MADLFSLAPEGQAWADDRAENNPTRPEDFEPTFFQGAIAAPARGVVEGTIGLAQSAVGFSKRLISDPAFTADVAPTVNIFRVMFPDADKALNDTYDTIGKQLQDARGYVKPSAGSQGTAAEVLYGLGHFVPAIGATIVGGPTIGAATAFSSTYEQSYQDFKGKGVDESTARNLATQQSLFNAAGMALPAAVGTTLATRIASGVAINTGFGGLNRYSVGETLEKKGYTEMAKQYRVFDGQAMLVDAVLGGAFGGVHHLAARNTDAPPPADTEAPIPAAEVQSVPDSTAAPSPVPESASVTDTTGTPLRSDAQLPVTEQATTAPDIPAIKPSDIDAAHTLNEGLYYDLESSPVLHASNESINSHVAAMDEAAMQIMNGQPVNITMQARGLDGPVRPGALDATTEQYNAMESVFKENGISYSTPKEIISEPQAVRNDSAFANIDDAGQVSVDPDTGETISSNNFDLLAARDMASAHAEMTITHPDTGQPMKLSEALAQFDEQITTVQKESKVYSVAAACFLRNS